MARLVFDLGGTNLRMALADGATLRDPRKGPSSAAPDGAIAALARYARDSGVAIDAIVGGMPGIVRDGVAVDLPHLPGWNGYDVGAALERALGAEAALGNDADMGGLGEAVLGAGAGARVVAYLAVGTGVGGTVVEDGRVRAHALGFEPGKQVLELSAGRTLEGLVGGASLAAEFGGAPATLPASVYEERTHALAVGIANAVWHWSPDVVVLNGSMMSDENGFRLGAVRAALVELPGMGDRAPRVVRAAFGDASGLYGASCLPVAG